MRPVTKKVTKEFYIRSIVKAQEYLSENITAQPDISEIADHVGISKFHFHRIYQHMTGESLQQYARRVRLENSAMMLIASNRSILDIALDYGYGNHESFTRAFKKHFGVSPKRFRVMRRAKCMELISAKKLELSNYEETMEVKIQKMEETKIAYLKHTGPYTECGKTWEKLCASKELMSRVTENTMFMGLCYDDPDITEDDKIRLDVCMSVDKDFEVPEQFYTKSIPAGDYAVLRHVGSYSGLHDRYRWLYSVWLPDSGRKPKESYSMEIYRNSPETTPEEELVTDICIPLE
jgi:AraC family transcriptional regulator